VSPADIICFLSIHSPGVLHI